MLSKICKCIIFLWKVRALKRPKNTFSVHRDASLKVISAYFVYIFWISAYFGYFGAYFVIFVFLFMNFQVFLQIWNFCNIFFEFSKILIRLEKNFIKFWHFLQNFDSSIWSAKKYANYFLKQIFYYVQAIFRRFLLHITAYFMISVHIYCIFW